MTNGILRVGAIGRRHIRAWDANGVTPIASASPRPGADERPRDGLAANRILDAAYRSAGAGAVIGAGISGR